MRANITGISIAALAVSFCMGVTSPAFANDDGQEGLLDSLLGAAGLGSKVDPEIDYRDHPPLVLPPKMALRQPVPAAAQRSAAWPKDPDVARRAREAAAAGLPAKQLSTRELARPSTKEELLAGRASPAAVTEPVPTTCAGSRRRDCNWIPPDVLRSQGVLKTQAAAVTVGTEPDRRYLTEPPVGYRKVTKAVAVRLGAPPVKEDNSPLSFFKKVNPWDKEED